MRSFHILETLSDLLRQVIRQLFTEGFSASDLLFNCTILSFVINVMALFLVAEKPVVVSRFVVVFFNVVFSVRDY